MLIAEVNNVTPVWFPNRHKNEAPSKILQLVLFCGGQPVSRRGQLGKLVVEPQILNGQKWFLEPGNQIKTNSKVFSVGNLLYLSVPTNPEPLNCLFRVFGSCRLVQSQKSCGF